MPAPMHIGMARSSPITHTNFTYLWSVHHQVTSRVFPTCSAGCKLYPDGTVAVEAPEPEGVKVAVRL